MGVRSSMGASSARWRNVTLIEALVASQEGPGKIIHIGGGIDRRLLCHAECAGDAVDKIRTHMKRQLLDVVSVFESIDDIAAHGYSTDAFCAGCACKVDKAPKTYFGNGARHGT